jgi:hypothetical protein
VSCSAKGYKTVTLNDGDRSRWSSKYVGGITAEPGEAAKQEGWGFLSIGASTGITFWLAKEGGVLSSSEQEQKPAAAQPRPQSSAAVDSYALIDCLNRSQSPEVTQDEDGSLWLSGGRGFGIRLDCPATNARFARIKLHYTLEQNCRAGYDRSSMLKDIRRSHYRNEYVVFLKLEYNSSRLGSKCNWVSVWSDSLWLGTSQLERTAMISLPSEGANVKVWYDVWYGAQLSGRAKLHADSRVFVTRE